jgi:glycosyltransferase involved in cell wall biosynthesis
MNSKPTVVIFFNDWKVYPNGVNAGGGESATMALAREMANLGHRVIACANLPEGETTKDGIEFWNFGAEYNLHLIEKRLRDVGSYYAFCATLVHPFLHLREHTNCLSRIVINHAPSAHASGLEPATVMTLIDYMTCVSFAQRNLILGRGTDPEKLVVVKNGFDPEIFEYSGPEERDWNQLIFIGRIEPAKGIHILVQIFSELKNEFPDLKLSIFGDENYWPDFVGKKHEFEAGLPGLKFHGKVPQRELSKHLRKAGLLVFPSISFESAGLAVVDAQASGCPVVAYGVGGVPEYLNPKLGEIVSNNTPAALKAAIVNMLRDTDRRIQISKLCATVGRERPWRRVAEDTLSYASKAAQKRMSGTQSNDIPESIERISNVSRFPAEVLLEDHEDITSPDNLTDEELLLVISSDSECAWPHLVQGLRYERKGNTEAAIKSYKLAAIKSSPEDWQPYFRLALLHADRQEFAEAVNHARTVLSRAPLFPLRSQLEQLISLEGSI